jgi:hypothetical protein
MYSLSVLHVQFISSRCTLYLLLATHFGMRLTHSRNAANTAIFSLAILRQMEIWDCQENANNNQVFGYVYPDYLKNPKVSLYSIYCLKNPAVSLSII